jgi:winged helix DNA-binding protein
MSNETLIAARLSAQLLSGPPARDPVAVAERLLAVQGQDPRGVRLAVRARSTGLSKADVDRALTEHRSLVITWLNRGTLHLVRSEDYPWLHALTTPPLFTASARRLAQEGVSPDAADRGVAAIERALADEGPLTRAQLKEHVAAAGVRTEGLALVHVIWLACLRGLAVRGPVIGGHHAYALVRDWLGEPARVDRNAALAELARRFLAGHGPATDRDLAKWAGLPLRDARPGLEAIAPRLVHREHGLVDLTRRAPAAELPAARLLGAFDPVLLGWTAREPLLGRHEAAVTIGGMFVPFALVRGRGVATWKLKDGALELTPFGRLARADRGALEADAVDVVRFLTDA